MREFDSPPKNDTDKERATPRGSNRAAMQARKSPTPAKQLAKDWPHGCGCPGYTPIVMGCAGDGSSNDASNKSTGDPPHSHHAQFHRKPPASNRLLLTMLLSLVILVAEVIGGLLTNSLALLADAGHTLTDFSALLLAFFALKLAKRPPDPKRSFGYYRLEVLGALINGALLLALSIILVIEAISRFQQPREVDSLPMMGVATIGLAANLLALKLLHPSKENINIKGAFLHVLGDTLSSVSVIVGGGLMLATGIYQIDPALTCIIAVVISVSSVRLLREAVDVLLESVPAHIDSNSVAEAITSCEGVLGVHDLHIWSITSGIHALSAHLVVSEEGLALSDLLLGRVKKILKEKYHITHTTIQVESEDYLHTGEIH